MVQRALHKYCSLQGRSVDRSLRILQTFPVFPNQSFYVAPHPLLPGLEPLVDILAEPNRDLRSSWLGTAVELWAAWAAFRSIH